MPDGFIPLLQPPDTPAISGSRWFHVRGSDIFVSDTALAEDHPVEFLGMDSTVATWAVDVPDDADLDDPTAFVPLRNLWGRLSEADFVIAGRALQLVDWARTHRFCGRCGTATERVGGERAMRCPSCRLMAFPRLAPAIIVLIERDGPDGPEALLARGRQFPLPMYSCLAGFVEPGETLEEAVHREVREEVGVAVDSVRYIASQPWPFPHSLMIGFEARWAGGDIEIDPVEIVDAQWWGPDAMPTIPPGMSIARRLIDRWLERVAIL